MWQIRNTKGNKIQSKQNSNESSSDKKKVQYVLEKKTSAGKLNMIHEKTISWNALYV